MSLRAFPSPPRSMIGPLLIALALGCGDDSTGEPAAVAAEPSAESPASPVDETTNPNSATTPEGSRPADPSPSDPNSPASPAGQQATNAGASASDDDGGTPTTSGAPTICERVDAAPLSVLPQKGAPGVAVHGDTLYVAGYRFDDPAETLELFAVEGHRVRKLGEVPVDPPLVRGRHASPAVAFHDGRPLVAFTDGDGRLHVTDLRRSRVIAPAADVRFPPAIAIVESGPVVIFADAGEDKPHAIAMPLGDDFAPRASHRLHPESMGGSAPVLLRGPRDDGSRVGFVDPRRGFSTVLLSELGDDGAPPEEPAVVTVIMQLYDPARVTLAQGAGGGEIHVGYTAVDREGKTAIGYLRGNGSGSARPMSDVRGYGLLDADAIGLADGVVFVIDSPLGSPDTSPREIRVFRATEEGLGPPLAIRGPDETARAGRVAVLDDGTLYVAYTTEDGIYVERVRCPRAAATAEEPAPTE